jgi:hypothetical protein
VLVSKRYLIEHSCLHSCKHVGMGVQPRRWHSGRKKTTPSQTAFPWSASCMPYPQDDTILSKSNDAMPMPLGSPLPVPPLSLLSRIIGAFANPLLRFVADPNILELASTRLVECHGRLLNIPSFASLAQSSHGTERLPSRGAVVACFTVTHLWHLAVSAEGGTRHCYCGFVDGMG